MTTQALPLEVHDFRQPRQLMSTSWRSLQRWYAESCGFIAERWRKLGLDVCVTHQQTRVLSLRSALAMVPEPGWGAKATLGATAIEMLLACPPQLLRRLGGGLLGETEEDGNDLRALTAVEESMAELLICELLQAASDAWVGAEPLGYHFVDTIRQPQRTRMFAPGTPVVVTTLRVRSSKSDENQTEELQAAVADGTVETDQARSRHGMRDDEIVWIMPQQELEDLIEIECVSPAPLAATPHPGIPRVMKEMPVSVTVELGRTHLAMSELTSLQEGDVVILEQSVHRLLNVRVGETFKFRGRPGRVGTRRCLEIQQVLEETSESPTS